MTDRLRRREIVLSDSLFEELKKIKIETGLSISEQVRNAIKEKLNGGRNDNR